MTRPMLWTKSQTGDSGNKLGAEQRVKLEIQETNWELYVRNCIAISKKKRVAEVTSQICWAARVNKDLHRSKGVNTVNMLCLWPKTTWKPIDLRSNMVKSTHLLPSLHMSPCSFTSPVQFGLLPHGLFRVDTFHFTSRLPSKARERKLW